MDNSLLDELLVEAMESEIKARDFYEKASTKSQSNAGKKLFMELAEFEQNHYERIKKIIELRKTNSNFHDMNLLQNIPMVRSEIEGEIEPNVNEITEIINLAIESEKNSYERYKKIAESLNEEGRKIFNNLAEEEKKHQKILEDEFYQISNKGVIIWD